LATACAAPNVDRGKPGFDAARYEADHHECVVEPTAVSFGEAALNVFGFLGGAALTAVGFLAGGGAELVVPT